MTAPIDHDVPPVEHRLLGLDKRKILPTLAVLALVIFWSGVIPALDEAVDADEIEPGTEFSVGGASMLGSKATFTPTPGWVVSGVPAPSSPLIELFDEGVSFTVTAGQFEGTPQELLDVIRDLHDEFGFEGDEREFSTTSGIPGSAVELVGLDEDGALFAMVQRDPDAADGATNTPRSTVSVGIQVIVEGPPDSIEDHADAIGQMIASFDVEFGTDTEEDGS